MDTGTVIVAILMVLGFLIFDYQERKKWSKIDEMMRDSAASTRTYAFNPLHMLEQDEEEAETDYYSPADKDMFEFLQPDLAMSYLSTDEQKAILGFSVS